MGERERARVLEQVQRHGGLRPGVASEVARETGLPEAEVFGAASFYHLLAEPDVELRICDGVSCALAGAQTLLEQARARGLRVEACGCLAACDRAPAALRGREVLVDLGPASLDTLNDTTTPAAWRGTVGPEPRDPDALAIDLLGEPIAPGSVLEQARARGAEAVLEELERSGLQGRGGAGFPAATKWRAVRAAGGTRRFVVCNADEGEPGTFKDREVLLRRPDLVLEGLAIAAACVGAAEVFIYLRGAFSAPRRALERALRAAEASGAYAGIRFELHMGHGAYICGEETALLEALEGRRGMPRCKPPYPTERGLWGAPTLMHNVETIACVPAIVRRGGAWFRALGRTEPGTKLYCVSGHVQRPGVYELPLGVCLDELVQAAGGYRGELLAFSPGGASSGFLPASERRRPLDFGALREAGSMLGSAGVVVLDTQADLPDAVARQLAFFERESCGQCAPCRIGTQLLRRAFDRWRTGGDPDALAQVHEIAWEMEAGSICGLGQAAALPLTSWLRHFGEGADGGRDPAG